MAVIYKNHFKSYATSRLVADIIFDDEFGQLCEELASLYKKGNVQKPEQEAFQDAFYCFLTQKETGLKVLSL